MFKNVYYNTKKSEICLWEQINGENLYTNIPWTPYLFVPSTEEDADAKTMFGNNVKKKEFQTYYAYKKFLENNNSPNISENNLNNCIQFLAERYHGIPDDEMKAPNLLSYHVDIEVLADKGFPDPKDAKDLITLITVRNGITKKSVVFGCDPFENRDYTGNYKGVRYIKCNDEEELLRRYFNYFHKFSPDVFTGFNIYGFDVPYIINRAKVLWGEDIGKKMYSRMSPIGIVNVWEQRNSDEMNVDIAGVTILDYMDLYKKYGKKLERYSLEYISQKELKVGKLKNPYGSLNELAKKDWNRYVNYNVIDCERVNDLEDKLGYIRIVQGLSLLCKTPMKHYISQSKLIEGLMLTYFRRNRLCAPHFKGGEKMPFKAAYIKDPQRGMHEWVVDIDVTSSYPSSIITLNMSLETFFGKIVRLQETEVINYTKKREFPPFKMLKEKNCEWELVSFKGERLRKFNLALKKGLFAISPYGSIFTTSKEGIIAKVQKNVFFKRKEVKSEMKKHGHMANKAEGDEKKKYKERERELDSLQGSLKVMMNAFYGNLSVPYSRYFNQYIPEAITSCSRRVIMQGEVFSNNILNNPNEELRDILNKIDEVKEVNRDIEEDLIVYIHTDSLFLNLNKFVLDNIKNKNKWEDLSDKKKIEYTKRISVAIENFVNSKIFNDVQKTEFNSQVRDFKITFKQEIVAKTMLVVQKAKYCYWLLDKEGVPKNDIKVTGLELVRSETAEAIRPRLKNIMEMILKNKSDDEIAKTVRKYRKELNELDPEGLAANIGINGIRKYLGSKKPGNPKKGTPYHVKGVYGYRLLLRELGIHNKYEDIHEGLKSKVVYIKKNPYNIETVSFYEWPSEFEGVIQLDSEKMIEKFFIKKIKFLLNPMGKEDIIDGNKNAVKLFF